MCFADVYIELAILIARGVSGPGSPFGYLEEQPLFRSLLGQPAYDLMFFS